MDDMSPIISGHSNKNTLDTNTDLH